jgi:hypothetical protein
MMRRGLLVVTLSTFVTLSINSAKGLARCALRYFAALILHYVQDDRAAPDCRVASFALRCFAECTLSASNGLSMTRLLLTAALL